MAGIKIGLVISNFIGTIDNLIYYKWMDKYCIRTTPKQMRQSEATKRAAKSFGIDSWRSKIIRQLLAPVLAGSNDKVLHSRLRTALIATLSCANAGATSAATHPLKGFRFADGLPLSECLKFPIRIIRQDFNKIKVEITAFDPYSSMIAPEGTTRVQLALMVVNFNFDNEQALCSAPSTVNIDFQEGSAPASTLELEDNSVERGILMVVAALTYWKDSRRITASAYNPVEVLEVYQHRVEGILS